MSSQVQQPPLLFDAPQTMPRYVNAPQIPDVLLEPWMNALSKMENLLMQLIVGLLGVVIVIFVILITMPGTGIRHAIENSQFGRSVFSLPKGFWFMFGILGVGMLSVLPVIQGTSFPLYVGLLLGIINLLDSLVGCKRFMLTGIAALSIFVSFIKLGYFGDPIEVGSVLYSLTNWFSIIVLVLLIVEYAMFDFEVCKLKQT